MYECVFCCVLQAPHPPPLTGFTWVEGTVMVSKAAVYKLLIQGLFPIREHMSIPWISTGLQEF